VIEKVRAQVTDRLGQPRRGERDANVASKIVSHRCSAA